MLNDNQLPLFPLDVCVPVQEFRADYTIVQQNQLPFVREFVLRLLDLSKMTKDQIGKFMGFSEKETEVALDQLINLDEIVVNEEGTFQLTAKSQSYFSAQQENRPKTQCLEDIRYGFKFDLLTFSYVKHSERLGNSTSSIRLYPSGEAVSTSAKSAKLAFQRYFHQIHEEEEFGHLTIDNPELYKISSFKKQSESYQRFSQIYGVDTDRNSIEPIVTPDFLSKEEVVTFLSNYLKDNRPPNNHREVATAFDSFDFEYGVYALKRGYLDVAGYAIEARKALLGNTKYRPFIGSIILNENWSLFKDLIQESQRQCSDPIKVMWVAPSENYWSKSEYQLERFNELAKNEKINLEIYLPIPHRKDKKISKSYLNQFSSIRNSLFGFVEGYIKGSGEVVIINGQAAFLICYLYQNEDLLPLPVGFWTNDISVVSLLESSFRNHLSTVDEEFESKNLGRLVEAIK